MYRCVPEKSHEPHQFSAYRNVLDDKERISTTLELQLEELDIDRRQN